MSNQTPSPDPETIAEELNLHFPTIAEKSKLKQRQIIIRSQIKW